VRRQAIVLLSDGEDTTSVVDYDEVLERAKRAGVIVFAIGLRDGYSSSSTQGFRQHDFALRSVAVHDWLHVAEHEPRWGVAPDHHQS
jgi:hypothetical protein